MMPLPLPCRILLLAVFAAALVGFGFVKGIVHEQMKSAEAERVRLTANQLALLGRIASNAAVAAKQAADNAGITKGKDDEIKGLTARVDALGRLRHGAGICGGSAAPTETAGPTGSDGTDSSGGLVREDVDRDIKALIVAVETDLATGRACQAFAEKNGLVP
jgi:prophage endopeptidase